ncbi:hypothetical protein AB6A40_002368 [Gnathostoma spinigerum]|uniref:Phospholipase A2 n=1 Tax=Gnathostoma spinigerum TaxID=75299 RepID=A0ABD6E6D6_9BILA
MLLFLNCALLVLHLVSPISTRRNGSLSALWNLQEMTECVLHYSALVYNNYGCWCGPGGSGKPMDAIDRCCMHHDKCYDEAVNKHDCIDTAWEYLDDYSWECVNKEYAVCSDTPRSQCGADLCECDRTVVECWKDYQKPEIKPPCTSE